MNLFKSLLGGSNNHLNTTDAKVRIDSKEPLVILDVRQPEEFRAGHIAGARLIPLNELGQRMSELPLDKQILCVCQSGSRSGSATGRLNRAGYQAVNLRGGMIGWRRAGYPVKKGSK
jgi:rhodanese-related sulfurtransferase